MKIGKYWRYFKKIVIDKIKHSRSEIILKKWERLTIDFGDYACVLSVINGCCK